MQLAKQLAHHRLALSRYGDGMNFDRLAIIEIIGGVLACIGVGMLNVPAALISAGVLIVVACEANT